MCSTAAGRFGTTSLNRKQVEVQRGKCVQNYVPILSPEAAHYHIDHINCIINNKLGKSIKHTDVFMTHYIFHSVWLPVLLTVGVDIKTIV